MPTILREQGFPFISTATKLLNRIGILWLKDRPFWFPNGMSTSTAVQTDERVKDVKATSDTLAVSLFDGRTISTPLFWSPRLLKASALERATWEP
jgi:hypothetical protein